MRALLIAVILTLALGFTVRDLLDASGASPTDAWEGRAEDFDESVGASEAGDDFTKWFVGQLEWARAD